MSAKSAHRPIQRMLRNVIFRKTRVEICRLFSKRTLTQITFDLEKKDNSEERLVQFSEFLMFLCTNGRCKYTCQCSAYKSTRPLFVYKHMPH